MGLVSDPIDHEIGLSSHHFSWPIGFLLNEVSATLFCTILALGQVQVDLAEWTHTRLILVYSQGTHSSRAIYNGETLIFTYFCY